MENQTNIEILQPTMTQQETSLKMSPPKNVKVNIIKSETDPSPASVASTSAPNGSDVNTFPKTTRVTKVIPANTTISTTSKINAVTPVNKRTSTDFIFGKVIGEGSFSTVRFSSLFYRFVGYFSNDRSNISRL